MKLDSTVVVQPRSRPHGVAAVRASNAVRTHLTMYAAPDDFGEGNDTEILTHEAITPLC